MITRAGMPLRGAVEELLLEVKRAGGGPDPPTRVQACRRRRGRGRSSRALERTNEPFRALESASPPY